MADVSGLYPQPPSGGGGNILASNPLQLIGAMNALNQNALFQKSFAAKQAVGSAFQNALSPDGNVDIGKLSTGLQHPDAAFAAPEAIGTLLDQRGKMISNDTAAFGLAAGQNRTVQDAIGAMAQDPNLTADKVRSTMATIARNTNLPSGMLNSVLQTMPSGGKALQNWAANLGNVSMGAAGSATRVPGPPSPEGAPTTVPMGAANIAGGMPTGTPPGTERSADIMQQDLVRAGNFGQEMYPWQQALDKIQALGPGGTGPGSSGRQQMESFVGALSPTVARWVGVDPEKIKNFDEFVKYTTQAVASRAGGFGHGTADQIAQAVSGNPSAHISSLANEDVIKAAMALRRMEQAQTLIASHAGPVGYTRASAAFAGSQDPRAYAIDMMSPAQLANLQKTLKGADRDKFNRSLQTAIQQGVISPPGQ